MILTTQCSLQYCIATVIGFEPETLEVEIIMVTTVNDTDCTLDTNYVNEQQRKKTREQQELL